MIDVCDPTAPNIAPPPKIEIDDTSLNDSIIQLGTPTVTDLQQITVANNAPKTFQLGMTTVTWTGMDASGNTANATQSVIVKDTTPPSILVPKDITIEATNLKDNVVNIEKANATDAVSVTSVISDAPSIFPIGKTAITWTATDEASNKANATQIVDVVDTTAPKITSPKDIRAEATSLTDNTLELGNATATDIEPITITNNAPAVFPLGKTTVTWTATDEAGNKANATQIVDVVDTTAPKITSPKDIRAEATSLTDNTLELGNATATDIEPITITNNSTKAFLLGKTVVLWTATDEAGNKANATQIVDVVDTTAPKITPPPKIEIEATSLNDSIIQLGTPTVTDLQQITVTNNAPKTFQLGMTTVTWTAMDASGNTANATQSVIVKDTTPPSILVPKDITIEATNLKDNVVNIEKANATDAVSVISVISDAPSIFPIGKTAITWTATDEAGNKANATKIVDVVDTTAPMITLTKDIRAEATSLTDNTLELGNATATDIEPVTITNNSTKAFPLGKTVVLWTATDEAGNKANATQIVDVVDTASPIISITSPTNNTSVNTAIVSLSGLASDSGSGVHIVQVRVDSAPFTDATDTTSWSYTTSALSDGFHTITAQVIDNAENTAITKMIVTVDTAPPNITPPAEIKIEATSLNDNTVTIDSPKITDIEPITITNNSTKAFPLGKTVVLWTATDEAGNKANATQIVDVVDTIDTKITSPKNIRAEATSPTSNRVDIGNATISDDVKVVSVSNDAPAVFPFGNTTVTWTVKDGAGNTASATQLIQVVDRTPPKLVMPSDIVVNATAFETPITIGQATASGIMDQSPKITNNATSLFH